MAQAASLVPQRDAEGNVIPLDDSVAQEYRFGGRVAEQMDAFMEEGTEGANQGRNSGDGDAARAQAAHVVDWREKLEGMSFDERVEATVDCVMRRSTFRDILYGLLGFCLEERSYEEIEPYVESFVEYHRNRQSQRRYVMFLLRTGALVETELDESGNVLTEEAKQAAIDAGLDPEDVDTLVFDWRVSTTDVGRAAYERLDARVRIAELISSDPAREDAFIQIMRFCDAPHCMGDIIDAFGGKDILGFDEEAKQMRQPSAYVTKLDGVGALAWDGDKWLLTEKGREFLAGHVDG